METKSHERSSTAIRLRRLAFLAILTSLAVPAQQPTAGEKTRPDRGEQSYNAPGATYTGKPDQLLDTLRVKAVVTKVDPKERTLTVVPALKGQKFRVALLGSKPLKWSEVAALEMGFLTPAGSEQIKLSKKAGKALGKKKLEFAELTVGSKVRCDYYPLRTADDASVAVREIMVDELGK